VLLFNTHSTVLLLKLSDVLVRSLLIVEQAADAGTLLVLDDLLFQNLELELHEVNLLLQVLNVESRCVLTVSRLHEVVGVGA
jgi:hypothetical protein